MTHLPAKGPGPSTPSDDLKAVMEVARGQIEQEFRISERLDNKARNQVALAGTWYALAQVIAGLAFRMQPASSLWSVIVGVLAAAGGILVGDFLYVSFFNRMVGLGVLF